MLPDLVGILNIYEKPEKIASLSYISIWVAGIQFWFVWHPPESR